MGRHALKAGADYRRLGLQVAQGRNSEFFFNTGFTRGPDPSGTQNGDGFASFLLGVADRGAFSIATPNDVFTNYVGGYVQDDFLLNRMSP